MNPRRRDERQGDQSAGDIPLFILALNPILAHRIEQRASVGADTGDSATAAVPTTQAAEKGGKRVFRRSIVNPSILEGRLGRGYRRSRKSSTRSSKSCLSTDPLF